MSGVQDPYVFPNAMLGAGGVGGALTYADGSRVRRNDEVAIAGEPGIHRYRVVAMEPERGMATIVGEMGMSYRLPASALMHLRSKA